MVDAQPQDVKGLVILREQDTWALKGMWCCRSHGDSLQGQIEDVSRIQDNSFYVY